MATVGDRIRTRRQELGWTQQELARKAGLSNSFLSDLENGRRSVSAENLLDISRVLGRSLDYLMTGDGEPTAKLDPSQDVTIPGPLSALAQDVGLSHSQTLALLAMSQQIIAHRTVTKNRSQEELDWRQFYESVKAFL